MAIGTTAAILGASGLGTSILGGIFGGKAASGAAKEQSAAAEKEAQEILAAVAKINPDLAAAMEKAIAGVRQSSEAAATGVEGAATTATGRVDEATGKANELLNPYLEAGKTATGSLLDLTKDKFDRQAFMDDEGYQFRLKQGEDVTKSRFSALGIGPGGRASKELIRFNQGEASSEYDKAFQRFLDSQKFKATTLGQLVAGGQNAAGTAGSNLIGAGKYGGDVGVDAARIAGGFRVGGEEFAGNAGMNTAQQQGRNLLDATQIAGGYRTDAASARAAGRVGRANAITGALSGGARAVTGALTLDQLLRNPAFRTGPGLHV